MGVRSSREVVEDRSFEVRMVGVEGVLRRMR